MTLGRFHYWSLLYRWRYETLERLSYVTCPVVSMRASFQSPFYWLKNMNSSLLMLMICCLMKYSYFKAPLCSHRAKNHNLLYTYGSNYLPECLSSKLSRQLSIKIHSGSLDLNLRVYTGAWHIISTWSVWTANDNGSLAAEGLQSGVFIWEHSAPRQHLTHRTCSRKGKQENTVWMRVLVFSSKTYLLLIKLCRYWDQMPRMVTNGGAGLHYEVLSYTKAAWVHARPCWCH